ncbi:MAG: hypothetical protein IPH77_19935 [Ignavibacteria bacterium]|nr:hypothetical protein [Ignavibacteria bacterium]
MITRKNRDVKFIIYQSLYIFVISVLALKGANLDLTEVVSKEKVVEKTYTDSLKIMIDSLLARGYIPEIKFDTTQKFTNPEEMKKKLQEAQQQLAVLKMNSPSITVNTTSPGIQLQQTNITEEKEKFRINQKRKRLKKKKAKNLTSKFLRHLHNIHQTL